MKAWLERRVPELVAAFFRFPLAIVLAAGSVAILVAAINFEWAQNDTSARLCAGLAAGAAFAVGGVLFRESRPAPAWRALLVAYLAPLVAFGLMQVSDTGLVFPFLIPLVGVLWTSVAGFTEIGRGEQRVLNQNRFWWLNQRALITGAIVGAGYLLIVVGLVSIERAVSILFRLDIGGLVYRWLLPVLGGWVAPVVWLSTIPRLDQFDPKRLEEPDFLSRAIAFLGQYIAAPLLLVYGAILLVYAGQIAITRTLPEGLIGWMVLYFAVSGTGTWLVLHPPFMQANPVAKLYRRVWWWLAVVPLVLLAVAIYIRVAAYGLTYERVLVVLGGVWVGALTVVFLFRRGDIRLIPGLAAILLALMSVGPWNVVNLPALDQAARLDRAIAAAGPGRDWSPEGRTVAREATYYLYNYSGRALLEDVALRHGLDLAARDFYAPQTLQEHFGFGYGEGEHAGETFSAHRTADTPVDVSATPILLGAVNVYEPAGNYDQFGIRPHLDGAELVVAQGGVEKARVDLTGFLASQSQGEVTDPWIDFAMDGRSYRFVVDSVTIGFDVKDGQERRIVRQLNGLLFAGPAPTDPPTPIDVREPPAAVLLDDPLATPQRPDGALPSP